MQYSHKVFSLIAGCLIVASTAGSASAQVPSKAPVVGVVDRDKVITSYNKAQTAAEELKKSEEKVQRLIEDSNKQYEEAKTAKKPPAELEGLQKRLQAGIDDEVKKVQGRAQALESQLENDIDTAIKAEAANRKVDVVILKQAVLMGGTDLTDGVVKRLIASTAQRPAAK
jgi:Skp family chaperone for outer membrane proteins